jgi:hypothetical protein
MQAAQKEGMLLRTDRTRPSRRVTQHRNRAVYLSRIYSPGAIATRGGIQPLLIDYGEMPPERQPLTFADEIA